ncbi:hypothetical protein P167DRAFT_233057 [Morchella conica CCBAS932]|uniref:Uncharacterized protein n=1 Tax=Morchella conica CCBAS932 TaxID=1392247 RepID=A0A3N4KKE4_9PEZI|nr:hypothetical protein P167DRAFT_233057 [Morchella conica CCBAS932]
MAMMKYGGNELETGLGRGTYRKGKRWEGAHQNVVGRTNCELSSTILPSSTDSHSPPREGRPSYVTTRLATPRHLTELHQLGLVCPLGSSHIREPLLCRSDRFALVTSSPLPRLAQAGRQVPQTDRQTCGRRNICWAEERGNFPWKLEHSPQRWIFTA